MSPVLALVAERDPALRCWMAERIAGTGLRVEQVPCVAAAAGAIERLLPDVAVIGDPPPDDDGRLLLELALARSPATAAVVVSSNATVPAGVAAMKMGAADFLVLPGLPGLFDAALAGALRVSGVRRRIAEAAGRPPSPLVGDSAAMRWVREAIARVADAATATVLLEGETGTGKEVVAQAIHAASARAGRPFLKVNCAALPDNLVESELFGHERGAFTAAHAPRAGIFEAAEGGTVLLDELGDLPLASQAKLLRLLEDRTFRRVGGLEERRADVRVIAATHADLEERVRQERFRRDLYFRLAVVRVKLPPLRARREDIPALAAGFVAQFNRSMGRSVRGIGVRALELLEGYPWPGNVRELRNAIERAFILYPGREELRPECLQDALSALPSGPRGPRPPLGMTLPDAERHLLETAMVRARGNQVRAARMLGITRFTLRYRLRKHGLPRGAGARQAAGA